LKVRHFKGCRMIDSLHSPCNFAIKKGVFDEVLAWNRSWNI
jgi:hypothetical protein